MTEVEEKDYDASMKSDSGSEVSDTENTEKDEESEAVVEKTVVKKGRGRPPKNVGKVKVKKAPTTGRGRGRPRKDPSDDSSPPAKKRKKDQKERTIQPGILRDTPRKSYKDESSSGGEDEVEARGSSDGEADYQLEKKFRSMSSPKREAGTLRDKTVLSYKDDSDSDVESGFESDIIHQHKTENEKGDSASRGRGRPKGSKLNGTDSPKKGRGRPKSSAVQVKRGRGRPPKDAATETKKEKEMVMDENGEMKPVSRGRGRPKGPSNKVKQVKEPSGRPRGRPKGSVKAKGRGRPKGSSKSPKVEEEDDEEEEEEEMMIEEHSDTGSVSEENNIVSDESSDEQ